MPMAARSTATRRCALLAAAAVHVATAGAGRPAAQQPSSAAGGVIPLLGAGVSVDGVLGAGATRSFRIEAQAGHLLLILIEQRGANIAATLEASDGAALVTLDAMDDEFRPERVAVIPEAGGLHTLRLSGASATAEGAFRIRLEPGRPATSDDRALVEAERAFARGRTERNPSRAATWPEALQAFRAALELFTGLADRPGIMKTLLEIGITENYLNQRQAIDTGREAARRARELDDPAALARALRLIGNILVARGDLSAATQALDEATAAAAAIGHRNSEARGLNDAAIAYRRMGRLEHAIELYERALPLTQATRDRLMEGNVLNNLGVAYRNLGDLESASNLYERALAHHRAAGNTRSQFNPLINLSTVRRQAGDPEQALPFAADALAIARTIGDPDWEASALNTVGRAEHARQEHNAALGYHRQALVIARTANNLEEESAALSGIGRARLGLRQLDEAEAAFQEALGFSRRMRFAFGEREDLGDLGLVERERGNLAAAARYLEESLAVDESLRAGITSPELRASFVAADQDRYELYLDVLFRRHQAEPAAGHDATALAASERARARVLLESLLDGGVDLREGLAPDLLERERALQRQINDTSEDLAAALGAAKPAATTEALNETLQRLTEDYARLRADIRRQSPRYADLTQPQPLTARAIQEEVLDENTVLLEFALGEERGWLWAVTRDTLSVHELPARQAIERAAIAWREWIVARRPREGEGSAAYRQRVATADRQRGATGRALSALLFGSVATELHDSWRNKRLAVVAAGVLDVLPFAALPLPPMAAANGAAPAATAARAGAGDSLGARHEVVRLPSASVVAALRRDARPTAGKTVAVLADPVFERGDPRVNGGAAPVPASTTTAAPLRLTRSALGRAPLPRLPFSREEADAIATLVPAGRALKATGFEATRETALGAALRDYRIVHFATHGVFDTERPALSGLVLSLVDRRGASRNGFVRLDDIYNLRLDAELVVLSACETALGEQIRGEGLIGIARAFMYAGAPRVVASLWAVDDLATAELMRRFYQGMLQRNQRPAAALHAAQREMQADPRWRDPYYWAGFTLVGDWR